MNQYATFSELSSKVSGTQKRASILAEARRRTYFNTFLSHSSKDDPYLPGVIKILEEHGARVYVDDGDQRLPQPPCTETAAILKDSIKKSRRFVLFVTPNSKDSNWIPWELGLGDGVLSARSVALFPAVEKSWDTNWVKQEYLGLYQRIVWGKIKGDLKEGWIVYDHHDNTATHLRKWLGGG